MIIKGLFRRYERWNPVHPTTGAFWGMGLGVGCGVGWGPGFGPEVIGYVGSGCGVGFSVGFTFLGLGIGLPANYIYQLPCNAVMATKALVVRLVEPKGLSFTNKYVEESWNGAVSRISDLQREASVRLSDINGGILSDKKFDLGEMKSHLFVPFSSISNVLGRFFGRFHPHHKGPQN